MDWDEIYRRIKKDPDDRQAFSALKGNVERWEKRDFWKHGQFWTDDVVAGTCNTVIDRIDDARGEKTFCGFVIGKYCNVRRHYLKEVKNRLQNVPVEEADSEKEPQSNPEENIKYEPLLECIDLLRDREKCAIRLRFLEELPYCDVAQQLKVEMGNARKIVCVAIELLRKCMQAKMVHA